MANQDLVDFTENSVQLFNKYFILPVLSLNASVTNLDSNVTTFTNFSSVIANASSITILNASTLANTSSITNINTSVLANTLSIINLNSSITNLNTSILENISAITIINESILANTSSISSLNTSLNNAIDTVNSTTLTIGGTNGTLTQSYGGSITSGTLNIASAITTGNINIGSANASNKVNVGGVLVGANAINTGTDSHFQIASTNITSSISIGSAQTSGILNIGTNASRNASGIINIGNTTSLSKINIETANTGNTDADPCIKIGTAGASAKLIKIGSSNAGANNTINLGIAELISSAGGIELNGISGTTTNLYIGNKQTSGILHLGSFTGVRTGAINIANVVGSTCPINIMNGGGATTGGSVNIANGTLQTTTVNIASGTGTGTVTIGNSANTTTINSDTININSILIMGGGKKIQTANLDALTAGGTVELANSNAGAVYIGASGVRNVITSIGTGSGTGSINLGNATNVVNVYGNLIMGTGRNITLQPPTGYVAPSSNTQLGFSAGLPGPSFSTAATTGNTTYCYSPPNGTVQNFLIAGVYLMSGYAFAFFGGTVSACAVNMDIAIVGSSSATPSGTGAANGLFNTRIAPQINTPTGDTRAYFPTYTFTVVTHQYYYISCGVSSASITGGGTVTAGCQLLSLVRIA